MTGNAQSVNIDQIEFWNGPQGDKWVRLQKRIDGMLGPLGEAAIERLGIKPGEHVLDVGCGTGSTSLVLADKAGPQGSVTCIDISRPMLNHARARAAAIPEYNLEFHLGDAQTYAYAENRFDALFSRYGIMFFDKPERAFANLGRATRAGGRLAFICWRNRLDNPWISVPVKVAKPHLELPPRPGPEEPGQFSFEDEDRVRRILDTAGWQDVKLEQYDVELKLGDTAEDATDFLLEMGPVALPFSEAPEATRRTVREGVISELQDYAGSGGVRMRYSSWIVTARWQ